MHFSGCFNVKCLFKYSINLFWWLNNANRWHFSAQQFNVSLLLWFLHEKHWNAMEVGTNRLWASWASRLQIFFSFSSVFVFFKPLSAQDSLRALKLFRCLFWSLISSFPAFVEESLKFENLCKRWIWIFCSFSWSHVKSVERNWKFKTRRKLKKTATLISQKQLTSIYSEIENILKVFFLLFFFKENEKVFQQSRNTRRALIGFKSVYNKTTWLNNCSESWNWWVQLIKS
jgi:hypothetical protein